VARPPRPTLLRQLRPTARLLKKPRSKFWRFSIGSLGRFESGALSYRLHHEVGVRRRIATSLNWPDLCLRRSG
jgi:hypothetical protein